jgi:hypothetical protein
MLRRLSAFLMLTFLAVVLVACEGSTANIQSATLSHGFQDNKATDTVTAFAPGDTFHLVVQLANAPDDTKVKVVWTAVDAGGGQIKDQKIDEKELTTGSAPIDFTLVPSGTFPVGKYKVDLYLNSVLNKTIEFQVQ